MMSNLSRRGLSGSSTPSYPSFWSGAGIPRPKNTLNARTGTSFAAVLAAENAISSSNGNPTEMPPSPLSIVRRFIGLLFIVRFGLCFLN